MSIQQNKIVCDVKVNAGDRTSRKGREEKTIIINCTSTSHCASSVPFSVVGACIVEWLSSASDALSLMDISRVERGENSPSVNDDSWSMGEPSSSSAMPRKADVEGLLRRGRRGVEELVGDEGVMASKPFDFS